MHTTNRRRALAALAAAPLLAVATAPADAADATDAAESNDHDWGGPVVPLKDARLKIEFNATDRDVGVQLFIDADPWKSMDVYDPWGRLVLRATARGSVLLSPAEDAVVDPAHLMVAWQRVGPANGSPIIGYQVLVVRPNTGLRGLPKIILDVTMPPSADKMAVPPGFLQRDSPYEWEVLAIESGGNQTLSVGHFRTPK